MVDSFRGDSLFEPSVFQAFRFWRGLRPRGLHLPDFAGRVHLPLAVMNFFQISAGASSHGLVLCHT